MALAERHIFGRCGLDLQRRPVLWLCADSYRVRGVRVDVAALRASAACRPDARSVPHFGLKAAVFCSIVTNFEGSYTQAALLYNEQFRALLGITSALISELANLVQKRRSAKALVFLIHGPQAPWSLK